ncbi:hypothetical protein CXF51_19550 [Bacillus subtilis subsp. subtilis]|nr:hypothetical protein CXF51_19550 [Bacillus subtilis subsp. subtilis]
MENKNVFANENVKLRLINLEYAYKEKFASNNPEKVKKPRKSLKLKYGGSIKKKLTRSFLKK